MGAKIKCLLCFDLIESKYRHDFVTCKCGNVSVDGGNDYMKVSSKTMSWRVIGDEELLKEDIKNELRKRK